MKRVNRILAALALGGCMSAWAIQSIYPADAIKADDKVHVDGKFYTASAHDYSNIVRTCRVATGEMPTLHNKNGNFLCVRSDGSISSTVVADLTEGQLSPVPYVMKTTHSDCSNWNSC